MKMTFAEAQNYAPYDIDEMQFIGWLWQPNGSTMRRHFTTSIAFRPYPHGSMFWPVYTPKPAENGS